MANHPAHILYLRPDAIGDAVLSAAMLPALQNAFPLAKITVACDQRVAPVYAHCPDIELVAFDKPRLLEDQASRRQVVQRLRALSADVCLHPVYSREPIGDFLALNSGCPQRVTHAGDCANLAAHLRERNNARYTQLIDSPGDWRPELDRHRDFLTGLGVAIDEPLGPRVWTSADDETFAIEVMRRPQFIGREVIALFAAAQHAERLYDGYGAALRQFCLDNDMALIALGSAADAEANQRQLDEAGAPHVNLCGQATLLQSAAVIRQCAMAVGAETGLAHVACAVGTRNVIVLGGGFFGRFMPYSPLTTAACLPIECYACRWGCRYPRVHCVRDIRPPTLSAAIAAAWHEPAAKPRLIIQDETPWPPKDASKPRRAWPVGLIAPDAIEVVHLDAGVA